ncbi:MAG TPA: N-formylglutamate deformylase [Pirellulaceae bacterium]|nr:N-formylglutamate deformylase [Pirellulaceae bacterium]HMO90976.1 N-formylglutamate deformylase [Pirellulaceae bacterium]HMP68091.1 N-formylglutamate deformylase [Pirellulaceae bacterium]
MFEFTEGQVPVLVSFPHSGTWIPSDMIQHLTEQGKSVPDTDWFLPQLYDLPNVARCSRIVATFSRYVIDVNRPPDGSNLYPGKPTPELCPSTTFQGEPIYKADGPTPSQVQQRLQDYWLPYHDKIAAELDRMKRHFGYALLYDAHSILSEVPRLFEGRLPDLNVGTAAGNSCDASLTAKVGDRLARNSTSYVINGRFIGGYITRHYGRPAENIDAIQMEMAQCIYMDEATGLWDDEKAKSTQAILAGLFDLLIDHANERAGAK